MIALIKIINIISGHIVQRKLVAVHSVMNKVTGVLLFVLPLTFSIVPLKYSAIPVCAVATFAAVQEGCFIRCRKVQIQNLYPGKPGYRKNIWLTPNTLRCGCALARMVIVAFATALGAKKSARGFFYL